ncbi:MAG: hypothetical protein ACXAE3_14065 [Candidatus Kariarchaeaceae archaeon]|jgi:hypothetical protein
MAKKDLLVTSIILLISASAFVSGFVHNNVSNQIDDLEGEIELWEDIENGLKDRIDFVVLQDLLTLQLIDQYFADAETIAQEYDALTGLTAQEEASYVNRIVSLLERSVFGYRDLRISDLKEQIDNNDQFPFFEYSYQSLDEPVTLEFFVDETYFTTVYDSSVRERQFNDVLDSYPNAVKTELLALPSIQELDNFETFEASSLYLPYVTIEFDVKEELDKRRVELQEVELLVSQLATFVSLSTVGVILSGSVSARRDQDNLRKEFEAIKAKIDGSFYEPKSGLELFNFSILMIAAGLSLVGLIAVLVSSTF